MNTTDLNADHYPEWVILHVPHDSRLIPDAVLDQFVINEQALKSELIKMTDHFTFDIYAKGVPSDQVIRASVSRLVVDVERFEQDALESMAERGMGVIYSAGSQLQPIRRMLTDAERDSLLNQYYRPHHAKLTQAVDRVIDTYDNAFLLDCHSFPSEPLPYEYDKVGQERPDICLGTDAFHTPAHVEAVFAAEFKRQGFSVAINTPFAGTLVPQKHYQVDQRINALMIEVNRGLYLDEINGIKNIDFQHIQLKVRLAIQQAFEALKFG